MNIKIKEYLNLVEFQTNLNVVIDKYENNESNFFIEQKSRPEVEQMLSKMTNASMKELHQLSNKTLFSLYTTIGSRFVQELTKNIID